MKRNIRFFAVWLLGTSAALAALLGETSAAPAADDAPAAGAALAHFRFDGNANDVQPAKSPFELKNTQFTRQGLYLNGVYEFGKPGNGGFHATCPTPDLDYNAFSVVLRFKPREFGPGKTNILTSGTLSRWFGLERTDAEKLAVTLNNRRFSHEIATASLPANEWVLVACSVDLVGKMIRVYFNGAKAEEIPLPQDFKLEVIGSELEERDRIWSFANYGNANVFHGHVDELIIYPRALSDNQLATLTSVEPEPNSHPGRRALPPVPAVAASAVTAFPQDRLVGEWTNVNAGTRGIKRLVVTKRGDRLSLEAWGLDAGFANGDGSEAQLLRSGETDLHLLGDNPSAKELPYGLATWNKGFYNGYMILRLNGEELTAEHLLVFTAGPTRSNYRGVGTFRKVAGAAPSTTDRYSVPDGDVDSLLAFLRGLRDFRPTSVQEAMAHRNKGPAAISAAAEKILKLKPDASSAAYATARLAALDARLARLQTLAQNDREALIGELEETLKLKAKQGLEQADVAMAFNAARVLEFGDQLPWAAEVHRRLAAVIGSTGPFAPYASALEGTARRLGLVGHELELSGKTAAGGDFDWASYRGKVVLVDFWATWCGPCVAELPNVKSLYEKYHDRGFEDVGVSLDRDRQALDKFLADKQIAWTTLHEAGGTHPAAAHYGVNSIPTMLLVGGDGKVVSLRARGEELKRLLGELLGPLENEQSDPSAKQ